MQKRGTGLRGGGVTVTPAECGDELSVRVVEAGPARREDHRDPEEPFAPVEDLAKIVDEVLVPTCLRDRHVEAVVHLNVGVQLLGIQWIESREGVCHPPHCPYIDPRRCEPYRCRLHDSSDAEN